jgi:hypothetical protein
LSWGVFVHISTLFRRPSPCDTHRFDSIHTHRYFDCDNFIQIQLHSYRPNLCLFVSDPSDQHTLFGRVSFLHRSSTTSISLLKVSNTVLFQRYEPIYEQRSTGRVFPVRRNTNKTTYGSAHIVIPCLTASCICKRYKGKGSE